MRTWLPTLVKLTLALCRYIGRNEDNIKKHMPEADWPKLEAVKVACSALELAVSVLIPPDV